MSLIICPLICYGSESKKRARTDVSQGLLPLSIAQTFDTFDRLTRDKDPAAVRNRYGLDHLIMERALQTWMKRIPDIKILILHLLRRDFLKCPTYRSCLFIGPPGVGKTTVAQAIAYKINWNLIVLPYHEFQREHRNQTGIFLRNKLEETLADRDNQETGVIIVIDEINLLFEHYESEHHDTASTAATFWVWLDRESQRNENFFLIGTLNKADKIPPQIQSRHLARIIEFDCLSQEQQAAIFYEEIRRLKFVLSEEITDEKKEKFSQLIHSWTIREIEQLAQLTVQVARRKQIEAGDNLDEYPLITLVHIESAFEQISRARDILFKMAEQDESDIERQERQFAQAQLASIAKNWHNNQLGSISELVDLEKILETWPDKDKDQGSCSSFIKSYLSYEQVKLVAEYIKRKEKEHSIVRPSRLSVSPAKDSPHSLCSIQ
jgi:DNA polymerase III delta prime subunit